jgi:hypothetical protein
MIFHLPMSKSAMHDVSGASTRPTARSAFRSTTVSAPLRTSAIAEFGERTNQAGEARYVFFGLRSDIEVAHYLTELIDNAVRSELGRYKNSAAYRRFRHQDRHVANSSFTLGMVASIADKLTAMKRERDAVNNGTGRDLVVLKASVVDAELGKLDLKLRTVRRATRMVSPTAYEAGEIAGASLAINPGIRGT